MAGTVREWLVVAVVGLAAGACGAPPLTRDEFADRTGAAAPQQSGEVTSEPTAPGAGPRIPERITGPAVEATTPAPPVGFGDGAAVVDAARRQLPGERALVEVVLYDGYGIVTTYAAAGGDVDRVVVRSISSPDAPRALPSAVADDDPASRFTESEVDWSQIPALVGRTPTELGVADGEVSHVIVEKNLPFSPDLVVRVYVDHPRRAGRIDYRVDGTVLRAFPG